MICQCDTDRSESEFLLLNIYLEFYISFSEQHSVIESGVVSQRIILVILIPLSLIPLLVNLREE